MSHIRVDASKAPCIAGMSPLGFPVFIQEFEVIYIYGQTEFKAQLAWMEGVCLVSYKPIFGIRADTSITNFVTGHGETVRPSACGRDVSFMLIFSQERCCRSVR